MTQREMTHLCVLYDSFTCDRQSLRYEHNDPFTYDSFICDKHVCMISALWLLCVYTMTNLCALWLVEVPWLFDMCTKSHLRAMPYNLCAMTHAYGSTIISCCVRCDWLICAPWRVVCTPWFIHMRAMTRSNVRHDSITCTLWLMWLWPSRLPRLVCAMIHVHARQDWCARHDFWYAPWVLGMCVMMLYIWYVHRDVDMYTMTCIHAHVTPWYVRHDSCKYDPFIYVCTHALISHIHIYYDSFTFVTLSYMWHDSFTYVLWLIRMCTMIHSHMRHDSFIWSPWFCMCALGGNVPLGSDVNDNNLPSSIEGGATA